MLQGIFVFLQASYLHFMRSFYYLPPPLAQDDNTEPLTGPEIDRAALVALYNATDGDNWYLNTNWLSDEPIGNWYGVTINDDRRVSELSLWGINPERDATRRDWGLGAGPDFEFSVQQLKGTDSAGSGQFEPIADIRGEWESTVGTDSGGTCESK